MKRILERAAKYKVVAEKLTGPLVHTVDPFTPPPTILKPPAARSQLSPDDVSDFPREQTVPIPEGIPYPEGKYRPPTIPVHSGFFPYNVYLQKGKMYFWCACGISPTNPFCDFSCNKLATRNRPIYFNVNESKYYKLCTCKMSPDAPFCNGTHREVVKFYSKGTRGFAEQAGIVLYLLSWVYFFWNYYH